ncbi:tripartite tricarboxylate transporter substrate binding protein [Corynebacterium hindlerae]|uniref:tripartite tricarboxylate transporter substrate binding protein n=1 Tax=Corynebacterium hindlerae TaxID=699041 RepID=UPI003AAB2BFE
MRIKTAIALIAAAGLLLTGCVSHSENYPSKKIQLLVGYNAGGANDTVARAFAASLEKASGGTVLVINKPGAAGILAATESKFNPSDGYHLLLAPISAFTSAPLQQEVHYGPEDFLSIVSVSEQPFAITVQADSHYRSLEDLKNTPDAIVYSTTGVGSSSEVILGEILNDLGVQGRAVPYNGAGNVQQAVISGEVDVAVSDITTAHARAKAGEVRLLAVTGEKRVPQYPDTPTVIEAGFPAANYLAEQALILPVGADPDIINALTTYSQAAITSPEYQAFLKETMSSLPEISGEAWLKHYTPAEKDRLAKAYKELGIEI